VQPVIPADNCSPETQLTVPLVIFSAMVDSINPCAFSVLIFLMVSLVAAGDRKRILLVGGVYISAVFIFYLLSGIGLFSAIHLSGLSFWISMIGALVAIGLGLFGVIDTLVKKEGFVLGIPESKKAVIEEYIKKASLPAAFTLGILVGIFELPCTGGIYLAILGLMSRDMTITQGLPYLVLYNFIFVLPLILIVVIVAFGIPPERADAWRVRNRRTLRIIVALVMIAIGAIILFGLFG
jgi:cytochrome c biogenesis protein CcdA